MHVLITISSSEPEIKWNAVRFGNFLLEQGEDVTIFLNGPGVALTAGESEQYPIGQQAKVFSLNEGTLVG